MAHLPKTKGLEMDRLGVTPISLSRAQTDPNSFTEALMASFRDTGFAVVTEHGLAPAVIKEAVDQAKALFALPEAAKHAYAPPHLRGQRGYTPFGVENAKDSDRPDLKEFWHVGREFPPGYQSNAALPANIWPTELPALKPTTLALYQALEAVGMRVLAAIARGLGQPESFFETAVRDGDSILRLLHYPPLSPHAEGVRAGAHEDINVITCLLGAEEGGLQLLRRDGVWVDIAPPEGALVINVGDMLQRLTAGALPSTTHRVLNPPPERRHLPRYSYPFFLHFAPDFLIDPALLGVQTDDPAFAPITAGDYLAERLAQIGLGTKV
jgi:isopenicillin N synthase-like dioxygenase